MSQRQCVWVTTAVLALGGAAAGQPLFEDVTDAVFVGTPFVCRSVAWGDYDNDGWQDLFLAENMRPGERVALWGQEQGRFYDRSTALTPRSFPVRRGRGSVWGDYDRDGDLDVFVTSGTCGGGCGGVAALNHLLRNDRGQFTEVTEEAGLTDVLPTDDALWLDYDRDGFLDLYTGNLDARFNDEGTETTDEGAWVRNKLYRNRGGGAFEDVTAQVGLDVQLNWFTGGSNGGMAAADLNDDGWPDLYVGVYGDRNRLFLSDGEGGFRDATTEEIGDPGTAFDVTVGDVDGDGDLDLFQAAGGGSIEQTFRSLLLANLGGGQLVDATESAGLGGALGQVELWDARFGDLDNDGDLDLLTGLPHHLYLNDGGGFFTEATDRSGITDDPGFLILGDYDRDGFLDACFGLEGAGFGALYRNRGNGNHWLEVELAGVASDRNGIGARVTATAGPLRQVREILGGLGLGQDEMVAHFGLAGRTQVDELEIRWPSGQVDVFTGVAADQRIRVVEGQPGYWPAQPAVAEGTDTLVVGSPADLSLRVEPARFDAEARITSVVADLSGLGGAAAAALSVQEDGSYVLHAALPAQPINALEAISVLVDQQTRRGPRWSRLTRSVVVLPAEDAVLYDEGPAAGWQVGQGSRMEALDPGATERSFTGSQAMALRGRAGGWSAALQASSAVGTVGYAVLHLAFHPGDAVLPGRRPSFMVRVAPVAADYPVDLLGAGYVDFARPEWQEVELSLAQLGRPDSLRSVTFAGNATGTFYLDDIRLVAARSSRPVTAVLEADVAASVPRTFSLQPNYPNPFNGSTVIRFGLPAPGPVELAVYNLAGQKVAALVRGERPAGTHAVTWDGRDGEGRPLATGVYLCELWAGG
ncbi:MAG: FG-GAP-like repeat-containing protein, partial [Candidatus Latescibacterota bacterium]